MRYVYCPRCAFVFASPRMTAEAFARFYGDGTYRRLVQAATGGQIRPEQIFGQQRSYAAMIAGAVGHKIARVAKADGGRRPRLLDMGGSSGGIGYELGQRFGFDVTVVDPSEAEIAEARSRGMTGHVATIEDWQPDGTYELVLLLQTIDHLREPVEGLGACRNACRGLLLVDFCDFPLGWQWCVQNAGGEGYPALKVDHPSNLHRPGLESMLLRSAFKSVAEHTFTSDKHFRRLQLVAAEPQELGYAQAAPGPGTVAKLLRGCYQAHTWINRYHQQPQ